MASRDVGGNRASGAPWAGAPKALLVAAAAASNILTSSAAPSSDKSMPPKPRRIGAPAGSELAAGAPKSPPPPKPPSAMPSMALRLDEGELGNSLPASGAGGGEALRWAPC